MSTPTVWPPARPDPGGEDPYRRATALLQHLVVLVAGLDLAVGFGTSASLLVALVLGPLWLPSLRRYPLAPLLAGLAVLAAVVGVVLGELARPDHAVGSMARVQSLGLLLSGMAAFVLLLWARQGLPLHRVVALYGAGGVLGALAGGQLSWKYDLAVPVTLLALGLVERFKGRAVPAAVVLVLGVLGVLEDGRSFFGLCLLAATLTAWQLRPRSRGTPNRWFPAMLLAGLAVTLYLLATALLAGGYLGAETQERTAEQIDRSGSLLLGGRPEWAATLELVKLRPAGYGAGVVPNWEDIQAGKAGLDSVNVELEPVRQRYMFGGQFRLHAVIADLWVSFGWVGVALAATIVVALVRSLSFLLAARRAPTSVILITLIACWHLLFGPIYSNWLDVCAALGLVLVASDTAGDTS